MKPNINVTPLIDVLLVLLIIFMVITPSKPTKFETKIPAEPKDVPIELQPHINFLVVTVNEDGSLRLNQEKDMGTTENPEKLVAQLQETFINREKNGVFRENSNEIEKSVFIKAPKSMKYGTVAKTVDAVKTSGASPIALQIDDLN
jgi:biopolymer transport protein ExbD